MNSNIKHLISKINDSTIMSTHTISFSFSFGTVEGSCRVRMAMPRVCIWLVRHMRSMGWSVCSFIFLGPHFYVLLLYARDISFF